MTDTLLSLDTSAAPVATGSPSTGAAPKRIRAARPAQKKAPAAKASATTPKPVTTATKKSSPSPAKPAAAPAAKPSKAKHKLVRDSFTMPQSDFELIDVLKQRAMSFRHAVKKSELLRAGLQVLAALPDAQLEKALARITPLKTGRPKKSG